MGRSRVKESNERKREKGRQDVGDGRVEGNFNAEDSPIRTNSQTDRFFHSSKYAKLFAYSKI